MGYRRARTVSYINTFFLPFSHGSTPRIQCDWQEFIQLNWNLDEANPAIRSRKNTHPDSIQQGRRKGETSERTAITSTFIALSHRSADDKRQIEQKYRSSNDTTLQPDREIEESDIKCEFYHSYYQTDGCRTEARLQVLIYSFCLHCFWWVIVMGLMSIWRLYKLWVNRMFRRFVEILQKVCNDEGIQKAETS